MKTIEITVSPKGETKVETKGFLGSDCQAATRSIEAALGAPRIRIAQERVLSASECFASKLGFTGLVEVLKLRGREYRQLRVF